MYLLFNSFIYHTKYFLFFMNNRTYEEVYVFLIFTYSFNMQYPNSGDSLSPTKSLSILYVIAVF